jgi:hypothetical protein
MRARSEPALLIASLAWVAAIIHGAASAQHLAEWPLAAAFFGALAVAQLGLGALLAACAVAVMHDRGHRPLHRVVMRAAVIASLAAAMLAGGHAH